MISDGTNICGHSPVRFWTVITIWPRNSWYSCGVADELPPSMCRNMSAPSAAYATRDRHSERWGKSLQNRAAHFLDLALTFIPFFNATDIFFFFFWQPWRRLVYFFPWKFFPSDPLLLPPPPLPPQLLQSVWRAAVCPSAWLYAQAMCAEAAEAVNTPHYPYTHYKHCNEASWEIHYWLYSLLLPSLTARYSWEGWQRLWQPSQTFTPQRKSIIRLMWQVFIPVIRIDDWMEIKL